jgi:stage IV sporulation protein FB
LTDGLERHRLWDVNRWWSIGRFGGVPVRLHWSAALGALFFSGFRFAPGAWLGFVLVILAHELGHAFVVRRTRQVLLGVDVHGLGGECRWSGHASPMQRALIAWGGVWAQLALAAIVLPLSWLVGSSLGSFGLDLFHALTWSSLLLAAINLVPVRPLDGAEAWKLPGLVAERWRSRRAAGPRVSSPRPNAARSKSEGDELPDDLKRLFAKVATDARDARRGR